MPGRRSIGFQPVPGGGSIGFQPVPGRRSIGFQPVRGGGSIGFQPVPGRGSTGFHPVPGRGSTGFQPVPATLRPSPGSVRPAGRCVARVERRRHASGRGQSAFPRRRAWLGRDRCARGKPECPLCAAMPRDGDNQLFRGEAFGLFATAAFAENQNVPFPPQCLGTGTISFPAAKRLASSRPLRSRKTGMSPLRRHALGRGQSAVPRRSVWPARDRCVRGKPECPLCAAMPRTGLW